MKHFGLISLLLIATICLGACSTHDPVYNEDEHPTLNAKITLCGTVWDKAGNEIKDATVAIDGVFSVKTDEHGWYQQEINAGSYLVTCSAEGKKAKSAELLAEQSATDVVYIRNFLLPLDESVTITKDTEAEVETDIIEGNLNGIVTFNGSAKDLDIDDDCKLTMSPIYDDGYATGYHFTKGPRQEGVCQMMLCGVQIEQLAGKSATKVTIEVDLNEETQSVVDILYSQDGTNWEKYDTNIIREEDCVILRKAPTGYYGFFCDVTVKQSPWKVPLVVSPNLIDNLFGSSDIVGASCIYEYSSGVVIDTKQGTNQLRALLLELLAADYGLKDKLSTHTLWFTQAVKAGWACQLNAHQMFNVITYARQTTEAYREVEGDMCDKAVIEDLWYTRKHTGGGSAN